MNLEVLEYPILAEEMAPNVEVLLDVKVASAESRETQAGCCFECIVQKKTAATQSNPTDTRDRKYFHKRFTNADAQISRPANR